MQQRPLRRRAGKKEHTLQRRNCKTALSCSFAQQVFPEPLLSAGSGELVTGDRPA